MLGTSVEPQELEGGFVAVSVGGSHGSRDPDVYWGMAEAQRQLGNFANAKVNYLKVLEYAPDAMARKRRSC